jgi:hypothetical protein
MILAIKKMVITIATIGINREKRIIRIDDSTILIKIILIRMLIIFNKMSGTFQTYFINNLLIGVGRFSGGM